MQLSPLQLLDVKFESLAVEPSDCRWPPTKSRGNAQSMRVNVECGVGLQKEGKDESEFSVALIVSTHADADSNCPYLIQAKLQGLVSLKHAVDQSAIKRKATAAVNGCSLLYGSLREIVLMITGRSTRGPWLMPTVTFVQFGKDLESGALPMLDAQQESNDSAPKQHGSSRRKTRTSAKSGI